MGDNSVDMIPTALDNGELGQTRQWRINKSIAQRNHLGIFAHKWCHHHAKLNGVRQYHVNLLWCFTFTVNSGCHIGKVNYTDLHMSYCFNESR